MRLPRQNKYGARRTLAEGVEFASKREATEYVKLRALERGGVIADLELQPRYELIVNGVKIGRFTGDFRYRVVETGEVVVADAKGYKVRDYPLRKKLMRALFSIEVLEL